MQKQSGIIHFFILFIGFFLILWSATHFLDKQEGSIIKNETLSKKMYIDNRSEEPIKPKSLKKNIKKPKIEPKKDSISISKVDSAVKKLPSPHKNITKAINKKIKVYYKVIFTKCIGCGLCKKKCPTGAISFTGPPDKRGKPTAVINKKKCIGCGLCQIACPTHAIARRESK